MIWLIVLVAFAGGGYWGFRSWQKNAAVEVPTVAVKRIRTGENATVLNATGYGEPRRLSTISSKVTGKIVEVLVEEGMKVTKGQILARLDITNMEANLRLAKAQLEVSKSAMLETKVRRREAETTSGRPRTDGSQPMSYPLYEKECEKRCHEWWGRHQTEQAAARQLLTRFGTESSFAVPTFNPESTRSLRLGVGEPGHQSEIFGNVPSPVFSPANSQERLNLATVEPPFGPPSKWR